jgi:hypothetical protein
MSRAKADGAKAGGGCLCGAVRYEIAGPLAAPSACHCVQCRRHQGALGVYTLAPEERYTIKGKRNLAWYESSPGIRRGFCRNCGSKLFWQRSGSDQLDVTLGSMDEPTGLKIEKHIYLADAGDYYDPPSR